VQHNYLFTREEVCYLRKGPKPKRFHVPYLDEKRGYAGYDARYPAKSDLKRRSNVWSDTTDWDFSVWDETEILRGKRGPCQKAPRVCEIPIEVHTDPGDFVLDLFAGTGAVSKAARGLERRWIAIEKDAATFGGLTEWLVQ
jgi:DNA modification methylase